MFRVVFVPKSNKGVQGDNRRREQEKERGTQVGGCVHGSIAEGRGIRRTVPTTSQSPHDKVLALSNCTAIYIAALEDFVLNFSLGLLGRFCVSFSRDLRGMYYSSTAQPYLESFVNTDS